MAKLYIFRAKPKYERDYQSVLRIDPKLCKDGFIIGSLIHNQLKDIYYICIYNTQVIWNPMIIEVNSKTIGQYTGIDISGEKIFEGDIVYINDGSNEIYEVIYDINTAAFILKYNNIYCTIEMFKNCIKIIGNIHTNPELMF